MPIGPAPTGLYGFQQRAGGQSTSGGFDIDAAMNDLLSRLSLPQPEPVKPVPLPAKILGGLADALNARAAALLRMQAPESVVGQMDKQQEAKSERAAKTAEGNRQVRNEVVTSIYGQKLREDADRRKASDKAAADEAERQARLEDAQRMADREHVYRSVTEYVKAGGKLPAGFSLAEATPDSVLNMISAGLQTEAGVDSKLADAMARAHVLVQQNPDLTIDDVNASTGQVSLGQRPREPQGQNNALGSPMTTATASKLAAAGVTVDKSWTNEEGLNKLAEKKRQDEEEAARLREARINAVTERGNPVRKEILAFIDLKKSALKIKATLLDSSYSSVSGAEAYYPPDSYLALKKRMFGSDDLVKRTSLYSMIGGLQAQRYKLISGANVTQPEEKRLLLSTPDPSDYYDVKLSKIDELIATANDGIETRRKASGMLPEDVVYIESTGASGIPSTPLPGMKKVAD